MREKKLERSAGLLPLKATNRGPVSVLVTLQMNCPLPHKVAVISGSTSKTEQTQKLSACFKPEPGEKVTWFQNLSLGSQITYPKPEFLATFVSGTGAGMAFTVAECSEVSLGLLSSPMDLAGGEGGRSFSAAEVKHKGPIAQKDSFLSLSHPEMPLLKLFWLGKQKCRCHQKNPPQSIPLLPGHERRG